MVQYVFTPWRDRQELLLVRRQFYGDRSTAAFASSTTSSHHENVGKNEQHKAVARVSMWMQRGNCPHMAESTALLMAAMLSDKRSSVAAGDGDGVGGSSTYAVRAAYSAAFSRFVTGLLDGHQDKQRKQSMYSLAKTIGLPATFVELRHQATHEQLPSLAKLRSAAKKALDWIWDYYWRHLAEDGTGHRELCREQVLAYLREEDDAARGALMMELSRWELARVLKAIGELQETLPGNQVFLKCLKLSKELVALKKQQEDEERGEDAVMKEEDGDTRDGKAEVTEDIGNRSVDAMETEHLDQAHPAEATLDPGTTEFDTGWSRYSGVWTPKPIGMV